MHRTVVTLLLLLATCQLIKGQRRISQIKCEEYRSRMKIRTYAIPLVLDPTPIEYEAFNCSRTVDLIVGGENAKEREFPHQALLGWSTQDPDKYDFRCGASLISEQYVLTAAHCTVRDNQPPVVVRMAELNLADEYDNQVDFDIASITRHRNYSFVKSYHDIALIKLKQKVIFSDYIRPACMWDSTQLNATSVIATGFGHTMFAGGTMSNTLRKVTLEELDRHTCQAVYRNNRKFRQGVIEHQLCFGSKEGGRDTCQGDSGGPIQVLTHMADCTFYVVGITSTGVMCGEENTPAIYTRVASYIDWIESIVWP
ncbi:serine protease snake-like [Ochlerotatus camptorhynchus]|uniref:serine protease snake-like n=1 Tax=Ochlerotatus camptorhynchus TaxID=644619 RepID=UPI0031D85D21